MIYYLVGSLYLKELTFISVLFAFALTILAIHFGEKTLPRDAGRAFAINGTKSVNQEVLELYLYLHLYCHRYYLYL